MSNSFVRRRSSSFSLVAQVSLEASVLMQRLSYPTETVLSNKNTRNTIVLSFKDSPRNPLRRRPMDGRRREKPASFVGRERVGSSGCGGLSRTNTLGPQDQSTSSLLPSKCSLNDAASCQINALKGLQKVRKDMKTFKYCMREND